MLGSVKIYTGGHLNWVILCAVLAAALSFAAIDRGPSAMAQTLRELRPQYAPLLLAWTLFVTGFVVAGLLHAGSAMLPLLKYGAILVVLLALLALDVRAKHVQRALILALILGVLPVLVLALLRVTPLLVILGDGRMGWAAIWPGVLWKVGAFIWPLAVWQCMHNRGPSSYLLALGSALAMALDGSRTSMLWLALAWLSVLFLARWVKLPNSTLKAQVPLLCMVVVTYSLLQPLILGWTLGADGGRVVFPGQAEWSVLIPSLEVESTSRRLITGDNHTRLDMLRAGLSNVASSFPIGCGFGCSVAEEGQLAVVVHMTYLQVLADGGLLALAGYVLILAYPLYRAVIFLMERSHLVPSRVDVLFVPVSVLVLYLFGGLFHPLSNELTEWGIVVAAIASIINHVARRH